MVTASNGTDAVVEHVFLLINTPQHGGDTFFRYIHYTHHLWPLLASLLQTQLQVFVKVGNWIDWLLLDAHTKSYTLTNALFNHRIILWIDGHVCDGRRYRATDVTTHMVWVHVVSEWNRESNHDVLAGMNVRHDSDLGTLKHRVIKEVIHHRKCFLFYIVCEDLAVFAILSF